MRMRTSDEEGARAARPRYAPEYEQVARRRDGRGDGERVHSSRTLPGAGYRVDEMSKPRNVCGCSLPNEGTAAGDAPTMPSAFPLSATPAAAASVATEDGLSLRFDARGSDPKPESVERSVGRCADVLGLEKSAGSRASGDGRGEGPIEAAGSSVEPPRSRSKMPSSTICASSSWLALPAPGGGESLSSSRSESWSSISERSKSPASDMSDDGPQRGEPKEAAA